jgi:hypothetical protein
MDERLKVKGLRVKGLRVKRKDLVTRDSNPGPPTPDPSLHYDRGIMPGRIRVMGVFYGFNVQA